MTKRMAVVAMMMVLAPALSGAADNGDVLVPGMRVRLRATSLGTGTVHATIAQVDDGTLLLNTETAGLMRVERRDLTKLEFVSGRHRNAKKGAIIGAAVGAVLMTLTLATPKDTLCPPDDPLVDSCLAERNLFVAGIPVVALEGALVGAMIKSDTWSSMPVDRIKVSLAAPPRGRGLGVKVSLKF
jgi:hypothetical protein